VKILVADDERFWRCALQDALSAQGYQVVCAEDAESAWRLLECDPEIALLVTDWVMPGTPGPELCRWVRGLERRRYIPIIVLTSRTDRRDLVEALEAGADAFVTKPFDAVELLAQIRVAERTLALELGLQKRIEELHRARRRIDSDLAQAGAVQRAFMPTEPPQVPGAEFAWHCAPCAQLGGDLFNVVRLSERHVGVHVLDVSGHGTSAALYAVSLSHVLHPVAQQGGLLKRMVAETGGWSLTQPSEVAAELNRRYPLIERSGHFVTLLYGILELDSLRFRYVRAGHPGPLWLSGDAARCCEEGGDVPIGVMEDATYHDVEIQLERGDVLLLLTDGVLETRSPQGETFGVERALERARRGAPHGAGATIDSLRAGIEDFRKDAPQRDDVTAVALRLA